MKEVDLKRIEKAVLEIIEAVGEDPNREGLKDTPARVSRMYAELLDGMRHNPSEHLGSVFHEKYDEIVLLRDIPFYSICEHHMMPFIGTAHLAYLPDGKVLGVSKLARVIDAFARRLQVQERLTNQIADALEEILDPAGVAVAADAAHFCMMMRGVQKQDSTTLTSAMRGVFKSNDGLRREFMESVRGR